MLSGGVNLATEAFMVTYIWLLLINFDRLKKGDKDSTVCFKYSVLHSIATSSVSYIAMGIC